MPHRILEELREVPAEQRVYLYEALIRAEVFTAGELRDNEWVTPAPTPPRDFGQQDATKDLHP